jgi:Flp pilus assembly protein TadG
MTRLFNRLRRDERGASVIEFALLAPVFIGLMMGVVQVGLYMQNLNAVRSLGTDAARFAAVEYQKNNKISEATLEANIRALATATPYNLTSSRLVVEVDEVTPSPVTGARQFDLTLTYNLPDIVGGISIDNVSLSYERQIFVLA